MKSMFIAICMIVSMLWQTSQAAEPKMSPRIIHAFEVTFADAENAEWTVVGNLYKVDFRLDDRPQFAFFNSNGEMVVNGRYLKTSQLPKVAQKKLTEAAQGYTITEVFVVSDGLESKYYATLDSGTEQKIVESTGAKWSTFKKSSK